MSCNVCSKILARKRRKTKIVGILNIHCKVLTLSEFIAGDTLDMEESQANKALHAEELRQRNKRAWGYVHHIGPDSMLNSILLALFFEDEPDRETCAVLTQCLGDVMLSYIWLKVYKSREIKHEALVDEIFHPTFSNETPHWGRLLNERLGALKYII